MNHRHATLYNLIYPLPFYMHSFLSFIFTCHIPIVLFIAGIFIGVTRNHAHFCFIMHDELIHTGCQRAPWPLTLVHIEHGHWSFDSMSRESLVSLICHT